MRGKQYQIKQAEPFKVQRDVKSSIAVAILCERGPVIVQKHLESNAAYPQIASNLAPYAKPINPPPDLARRNISHRRRLFGRHGFALVERTEHAQAIVWVNYGSRHRDHRQAYTVDHLAPQRLPILVCVAGPLPN
jgi:hypothetical protein